MFAASKAISVAVFHSVQYYYLVAEIAARLNELLGMSFDVAMGAWPCQVTRNLAIIISMPLGSLKSVGLTTIKLNFLSFDLVPDSSNIQRRFRELVQQIVREELKLERFNFQIPMLQPVRKKDSEQN